MPQLQIPAQYQGADGFGGQWNPNIPSPPIGPGANPASMGFQLNAMDRAFQGMGMQVAANDADHFGFLQSQVAHLETQQWRQLYADIQYPMLVPVDRSAWEWAPSIERFTMDSQGRAQPMGNRAEDMPLVNVTRERLTLTVEDYWVGYDYTVGELEVARRVPGINLLGDKAMTANRVMDEALDRIMLIGDAAKGWDSLLQSPLVSRRLAHDPTAGTTPGHSSDFDPGMTWAGGKTGLQMANDINDAIDGIYTDTETVIRANTILLPPEQYQLISRTPISTDFPDRTVMDWVMNHNSYTAETGQPIMIRVCRGLETAGRTTAVSSLSHGGPASSDSAAARMIAYLRDPSVLRLHIPMSYRMGEAYMCGPYRYLVPGMMRTAGLEIRLPAAMRVVDGI